MRKNCNTIPPVEIYDVLHAAEEKGINLPDDVEEWWMTETILNEKERIKNLKKEIHNGTRNQKVNLEKIYT